MLNLLTITISHPAPIKLQPNVWKTTSLGMRPGSVSIRSRCISTYGDFDSQVKVNAYPLTVPAPSTSKASGELLQDDQSGSTHTPTKHAYAGRLRLCSEGTKHQCVV
jgi:hypothetical protein